MKPKLGTNQFGSECITYEGIGGTKKWERLETYGPKPVSYTHLDVYKRQKKTHNELLQ